MNLEHMLNKAGRVTKNIGYAALILAASASYAIYIRYSSKPAEEPSVPKIEIEEKTKVDTAVDDTRKRLDELRNYVRDLAELEQKSLNEYDIFKSKVPPTLRRREIPRIGIPRITPPDIFKDAVPIPGFPGFYTLPIPPWWGGLPPILRKPYRGGAYIVPLMRG